jgi:hypothetical protein
VVLVEEVYGGDTVTSVICMAARTELWRLKPGVLGFPGQPPTPQNRPGKNLSFFSKCLENSKNL